MIIRDATAGDWPSIWPFFRSIVDAGETYAYPADLTSPDAQELWMTTGAPGRVVVAEDGVGIAGSARMGPNRPGRGAHVATASFMVDPARAGAGVGQALGEHVVTWARGTGFRGIQFNAVVETNSRAVALWQSLGFEIVGTVPGAFDSASRGFVGLHVMYLALGETSDI